MAYIGPAPNPGQNREVDDISSSFNGSTTAFTLQVSSQNVSPGSANAIIVSLGGVIQNPGTDYTVAASTITFTTAPASGLSFFGLVLGQSIDTEGTADNSITSAMIIDQAVTLAKLPHGTADNDGKFLRANNGADPTFVALPTTPILNSVTGSIIDGASSTLTLAGTGFLSANLVVNFVQASDSINANVTVTPSSDTAATVAVPSAVHGSVTAGNAVTIKVTNSDNLQSGGVDKIAVALPSGGTVTTSGSFRIHTFTSSGTFVNTITNNSVEYLVIAGGGSGGNTENFSTSGGSGGGAGGYRSSVSSESSGGGASAETAQTLSAASYTITVGGGGAAQSSHAAGNNGSNSSFAGATTITSIGGGGGGGGSSSGGGNGGSGGGGGYNGGNAGSGTSGQGFAGAATSTGGENVGGGGGGAGAAATNAVGGVGVSSSINGSATFRGGGGGGAGRSDSNGGSGGNGGGGRGTNGGETAGIAGTANTGGGGGATGPANNGTSGAGGSGIVILRYAI